MSHGHLNLCIVSERQQHFTHRVKGLFHICAFTFTGIYLFPLKVLRNGWPLIMFCLFQIQVYMASEEWQNKQINITKQRKKQVEHGLIVWEVDRMNDEVIYPYTRMNDEVIYPCIYRHRDGRCILIQILHTVRQKSFYKERT